MVLNTKKIRFQIFFHNSKEKKMATSTNNFSLAPELLADTIPLKSIGGNTLSLCYLGLMNNQHFPWLIMVPQQANLREIIDLSKTDQHKLMDEISLVSNQMKTIFAPHKLNVAALGNMVAQLHIHIIARNENDAAWPNPVWGHAPTKPYDEEEKLKIINRLK
jgi:diadenosine tetraphosphate (Ap4A) HIT family hydrolase